MDIDLKRFFELLSIPSISSEKAFSSDVRRCAHWVKSYLESIGYKTELIETDRHPILIASYIVDLKQKTLLIYNHYDVQPVDPLELWKSPPFEPTIRDGEVFARGAQDNKGQLFYVLSALSSLKKPPINIKLCIEGEEECGSKSLHDTLPKIKDQLKADYMAIVDLGIPRIDKPAITLGTRGLITFELKLTGSNSDMHSGMQGGVLFNPIHALVQMLAKARNDAGEITIPGFYEGILPVSPNEKEKIDFSFDERAYRKNFDAEPVGGEQKYPPLERLWLRPTLEINGIHGGYTGDGFKTVIPAEAYAKLSCRLVPGQEPEKVAECLKTYFTTHAPKGMKVTFTVNPGSGIAARSSPASKGVQAFSKALSEVFQAPCSFILEGASIPIIPDLAQASGAEPILIGLGLPTDNIHAPNEHFGIDRLQKGTQMIAKGIHYLKEE